MAYTPVRIRATDDERADRPGGRVAAHGTLPYGPQRGGLRASIAPKLATSIAPRAPKKPLHAGQMIAGKYLLVKPIETGGMGTVWQGLHVALGMTIALKVMRDDRVPTDTTRAQFELEAQCAARVRSKHVVQVFDCGIADGDMPYIVMDFLHGPSLMDAVDDEGPLTMRETTRMVRQVANALREVHARGIVHRDVKPSNVMLERDVDADSLDFPYTIKLIDFGVAKVVAHGGGRDADPEIPGGCTLPGTIVGTPNFMAPEHFMGRSDPGTAADLWGLATSAFTAMTGRIPFEGDNLAEILPKLCFDALPVPSSINPNVPPQFDAWFAKACARDPKDRFQTPQGMADALERACDAYEAADDRRRVRPSAERAPTSGAYRREIPFDFDTLDDPPIVAVG
jgi:serine/threonine-protein kinase